MEPECEVVGARPFGAVEFRDLEVAFSDDVVVADDHPGDGGEEDGIRRKVGRKLVGAR